MTNRSTLTNDRIEYLKRDYERGFIKFCGLRSVHVERGIFQSKVKITQDHRQQDNFIHAGVMATMADHTAGYSAFTVAAEHMQILTIEFKINFLKPASGIELICRSKVIREGKQIIISESEVFDINRDNQENLVAKAMVTLMAVPKSKLVGKTSDDSQ